MRSDREAQLSRSAGRVHLIRCQLPNCGSASFAKTLLAAGLVDELNLMIEPILLGGGKAIFPTDGTARPLRLVKIVTAGTGVVICTSQPAE
jgi:dihydrofolate reductase